MHSKSCHRETTRRGQVEPCGKTAVALRLDENEDPYPVCAFHAAGNMVPLTEIPRHIAPPPTMTDRQKAAWPKAVDEARAHGADVDADAPWSWTFEWREESRPGRGRDLNAIYADSDHVVQIVLDVYGNGSVSVGEVDWIHSSADETCECEVCATDDDDLFNDGRAIRTLHVDWDSFAAGDSYVPSSKEPQQGPTPCS